MDRIADITLLFNSFTDESKNLYQSFKNANITCNAIAIEENGFLPDDVTSVYGFFLGDFSKANHLPQRPLYFNQIKIPKYWRIESSNSTGKVMDKEKERARIFYTEPKNKRLVNIVDWLDDTNNVRISEHYNKYGAIYCRTMFNKNGHKAMRSFFSPEGQEIITENFVTGAFIVRWQGKDKVLSNKTDFIKFFLQCAGLDKTAIYYNSLSYPFFASESLEKDERDLLFWNEPVGDSIPGNMQIILNQQARRTKRIYVQRKNSYEKLIELGASPEIVKELGYLYSYERENEHRPEVLICTNSEDVLHIGDFASLVPRMHFHVAALTEMSPKLMAAGNYENVTLYPNVKLSVLDKLFAKCDFYLDINRGDEIVDAVHRAFLNNMLIVGFEETAHNLNYTADTNTFPEEEYKEMAEALNVAIDMPTIIDQALDMQKEAALSAKVEDYITIVGNN